MSGPAHGNRNRSVHVAVRDLVALYLDAEGIAATPKRTPHGLSDSLGDDALDPDLSLAGMDLNVTSRLTHRLSDDLDAVTRAAAIRGVPVAGFVQWRGDRPVEQAYAILPLSGLAKLIRGDHIKT